MKLFVDNLTNVDFSYLHAERGLLGESWLVQLELDGSLNEQGMICDFAVVKKAVKQWFDDTIDHSLVVPTGMPRLNFQQEDGYTSIDWRYEQGDAFYCAGPDESISLVDVAEITEQSLAAWCRSRLLELFPAEYVQGLNISFVAEQIDGAYYHYSHGLQQHDGNCQRIAHGHRSKIEIYLDGQRDKAVEAQWAEHLRDIYIGTRAHMTELSTHSSHHYAYQAPQGHFQLGLPARCCYVMDTETTVELIANHLAEQVKQRFPDAEVVVKAYEGVGKGAMVAR